MITSLFLRRGDVVAFKSRDHRTGIIVMEFSNMMMVAVNLYGEEGRLWVSDPLPESILLYEASDGRKTDDQAVVLGTFQGLLKKHKS